MNERLSTATDAGRRWVHTVPTQVALRSTAAVAAVYLVLGALVVLCGWLPFADRRGIGR